VCCVLCGVRCVVCGVWCVVCGVWCVVCGVWCVVCGVWCVVCGVWCVVCAVWCVVCETNGLWGTTRSDDSVWCCSDENEIHSSEQKTYALQLCDEIDYVLQLTE
jgi:hypothetical protein